MILAGFCMVIALAAKNWMAAAGCFAWLMCEWQLRVERKRHGL